MEETTRLIRRSRTDPSVDTDSRVNDQMMPNSSLERKSPSSSEPSRSSCCRLNIISVALMLTFIPPLIAALILNMGAEPDPVDKSYIHNFVIDGFVVSSFHASARKLRGDWGIHFDITNLSHDSILSYEDPKVSILQNRTTLWTTKMQPLDQKAGEKTGQEAIFITRSARNYDPGVWNAIATNWTSGNSIYLSVQVSSNVLEQGLSSNMKDTTWSSRYRVEISCMIILDFHPEVRNRLLSSKYNPPCKAERKPL